MKNSIVLMLFMLLGSSLMAQKQDEKAIQSVIKDFTKAGDRQDADKLATYLDENYRIVMNRLFGSEVVTVMDRDTYLEKIRTKEYGGDRRTVSIKQVMINGNTASVYVELAGEKMTVNSLFSLVKSDSGEWKLISDTPVIN